MLENGALISIEGDVYSYRGLSDSLLKKKKNSVLQCSREIMRYLQTTAKQMKSQLRSLW